MSEARDIEVLKTDLAERLFKHLNEHLDPSTKATLTSLQIREVLHCVADYVYQSKFIEKVVTKAVNEAYDKMGKPRPKVEPSVNGDEFLSELEKI